MKQTSAQPLSCKLALVVLLLSLHATLVQSASLMSILRDLLEQGQLWTVEQQYDMNVTLQQGCMVAYVDGPAWATHKLNVSLILEPTNTMAVPQDVQTCLARNFRWQAAVVGSDYIPDKLQAAVGYQVAIQPGWQAHVLIPSNKYDPTIPDLVPIKRLGLGSATAAIIKCALDADSLANATACIQAKKQHASSAPAPPPPPKGFAPINFMTALRNFLGAAPFPSPPHFVSSDNPYAWTDGDAVKSLNLNTSGTGVYNLAPDVCQQAFASSSSFKGQPMMVNAADQTIVSTTPRTYDSCYVTQTQVFIYYSGECNLDSPFNATIRVTAKYSPYNQCNNKWPIKLSQALRNMLDILGLPIIILLIVLATPTTWRLVSWPFRHCYICMLKHARMRTAIKHQMRMQVGSGRSCLCCYWCGSLPPCNWLFAMRKRLLYACVTIDIPDGYSRLLQVTIISICTVCVTAMVWRPKVNPTLDANPSQMVFQLPTSDGPTHGLSRYFQIMLVSMALGCVAFLASLANINTAGNPSWRIQCFLSSGCLLYLVLIVGLQLLDLGSRLPYMHDVIAYSWIVGVQGINVILALSLQFAVVLRRHRPTVAIVQHNFGLASASAVGESTETHDDRNSIDDVPSTRSTSTHTAVATITFRGPQPGGIDSSGTDQELNPDLTLIHGGKKPDLAMLPTAGDHESTIRHVSSIRHNKERKRTSDCKSFPVVANSSCKDKIKAMLRTLCKGLKQWILEETELYDDGIGNIITVKVFRYPSWFMAGVLVAAYMLVFHYIKSLIWAKDLGECVVTPQSCVFSVVATWANMFSWSQLSVLQAASSVALTTLRDVENSPSNESALVDAIFSVETGYGVSHWAQVMQSAVSFFTPGNSRVAHWLSDVGTRMISIGMFGYTLGVMLGFTTLLVAMASYKAIIKKHRVLKILQRLQRANHRRQPANVASDPAPSVAAVLSQVQQAAYAGTAVAHEIARTASQATMSFIVLDNPHKSFQRSQTQTRYGRMPSIRQQLTQPITHGPHNLLHPGSHMGLHVLSDSSIKHPPILGDSRPLPFPPVQEMEDSRVTPTATVVRVSGKVSSFTKRQPNPVVNAQSGHHHVISGSASMSRDDDLSPLQVTKDIIKEEADAKQDIVDVTSIAAVRALHAPIAPVVFFIGVLLSATVVQLYVVGMLFTVVLALITTQFFWQEIAPVYYPYLLVIIAILVLNKVVLLGWIGNRYVSDGDKILRPAGWFAFMIIASITNLVLGLFLAITRLVILLLTTIFTIGLLDRSILSVRSRLDLPYNSFLAGIHLQNSLTHLADPALRPGPRGRAIRRWRAAVNKIVELGPEGFEHLEIQNRAAGKLGCSTFDLEP